MGFVEVHDALHAWGGSPRQRLGLGWRLQLFLQPAPNLRPLLINDAEHDGISLSSVGHDEIMAMDAFLLRAQAKDGGARRLVDLVRGELHPDAVQPFKREAKH